ncbi:MAG: ABC transporter ATP-binding protein [Thermodesulfobacteriota bacterium]
MMRYRLQHIQKIYQGRTVLDIEDLAIEPENIYTLSGPNGSGKTTLLHILAFLVPPDAGRMVFEDQKVRFSAAYLQKLRKSVILVDQHPVMFSTTVYKNVEFGLRARGVAAKNRRQPVDFALETVGMSRFSHEAAGHLSGGETRRIAIARALACSPDVLLLDEPAAGLDPESRIAIEEIIRNIYTTRKTTIVLSTHNPLQAARLAGKTLFLFDGRLRRTVYENIFSGQVVLSALQKPYCRLYQNVWVPLPQSYPENEKVKIAIHPDVIRILHHSADGDASDAVFGQITQLAAEGQWVRAVVDIGIPINIRMEKSQYFNQSFQIGDAVQLYIQASDVRVIG